MSKNNDPKWLRKWWPLWTALLAIGFAAPEVTAIVYTGEGGTLSEMIREWLGVDSGAVTGGWWIFTCLIVTFVVWFPLHLLKLWPWEKDREDDS